MTAGVDDEGAAIFSAALGCVVTALDLAPAPSLFDYAYEHFTVRGYDPHPAIRAAVAV